MSVRVPHLKLTLPSTRLTDDCVLARSAYRLREAVRGEICLRRREGDQGIRGERVHRNGMAENPRVKWRDIYAMGVHGARFLDS